MSPTSNIKIALVEDDPVFMKMASQTLLNNEGMEVTSFSNGAAFTVEPAGSFDILIADYNLPDTNGLDLVKKVKETDPDIKTMIISGQTDVEVVVEAYQLGADKYIVKNEDCLPQLENSVKNLAKNIRLEKEVRILRETILDRSKYDKILGNSAALLKVLKLISKAERSNILVLLTGSSGTGKELVAHAIHNNSPRKKNAFVPVNVAAIPKDLIESELFGHEKGAFTGAIAKRTGKFEEANNGTLFLDEIGEMDPSLQVKLLRILEDQKLVRVGSNTPIDLDIRIIAATNQDLRKKVEDGSFREELYYRLQGFLIDLPDLKEREEDILLLAKSFLAEAVRVNSLEQLTIQKEAARQLVTYNWPGNVRELKSVIERAALLADGDMITPEDLMLGTNVPEEEEASDDLTMDEHKVRIIMQYLKQYDNNVDQVAKKLDIGKATIYRMLKRTEASES